MEEVLEHSREKISSFKDLHMITVFLDSSGALATSLKGHTFCFRSAIQSTQCFYANMK